jgi:hypothetical protein
MTKDQAIALFEARVGAREYTNFEAEEAEALIDAARHRVAREAWKAGYRALTEQVFSLTVDATNKKASFSGNTDLLPESIPFCNDIQHATVNAAVGMTFEILPEVSMLKAVDSRSELAYAAVGDNAVYYEYPAGTIANASTLLVRACKVPSIGSWPTQLEDRLIDGMVEIYYERIKANPPEEVNAGVQ